MPQPTPRDVHVDAALTNVSVAYMQDQTNFIADKIFPIVPVEHQSDVYFKYDKGAFFRDEAQVRAPASESAGSGFDLTTDNYMCKKWALHKDVDDDTVANADPAIDPYRDATTFVMQNLLIRRERLSAPIFIERHRQHTALPIDRCQQLSCLCWTFSVYLGPERPRRACRFRSDCGVEEGK